MKKFVDRAKKINHIHEEMGDKRVDDYHWLRLSDEQKNAELKDAQTKDVIKYLEDENTYCSEVLKPTLDLQNEIFEEIKSRIKEDDESVPFFKNGYYYITRYEKGQQYPIYGRKKSNLESDEEVILNVNDLAEGKDYYKVAGISISPDNNWMIFGEDTVSRRQYKLKLKNLQSGEVTDLGIEHTSGSAIWAADSEHFFYTKNDVQTLRSNQIYRACKSETNSSQLVFQEEDETFNTFVTQSKSRAYILIGSFSTVSTEYRFIDSKKPFDSFKIIQERERDLEYSVSHYEDHFYILTNQGKAKNFKVVKTSVENCAQEYWEDLIPSREDVLIEDLSIFKDFMVLEERKGGLNQIRIRFWDGSRDYYMPFNEETYSAYVYPNPEFDTTEIRYGYNSMTTPSSVIDFDVLTQEKEIKKEQEIPGGYDKSAYTSRRVWVKANDGQEVALSLVMKSNTKLNSETPILIYAYGAYGHTIDDSFSVSRLSLLDRGFVFALAHVRGGEYLGRQWYENGRLLNKKNTFTDFIDCADYLVAQGWTSSDHLYAMGGSAGGLLMGAVVNMRPELFNGVIAQVPFVDVLSTMLDESIPLTTGEYDEWGNPNDPTFYDYIKSYSPYDNVKAQAYPNMLVTSGYFDSQVQYWEPAKWVAKLREFKRDNKILIMHTDMDTGHSGASGRFDSLKEIAREFSFLFLLEGQLNK